MQFLPFCSQRQIELADGLEHLPFHDLVRHLPNQGEQIFVVEDTLRWIWDNRAVEMTQVLDSLELP